MWISDCCKQFRFILFYILNQDAINLFSENILQFLSYNIVILYNVQISEATVKKNAATILREAARVIKEEEKEIQK